MPKVLTNQQVERYKKNGYIFPVRALSEGDAADVTTKLEEFEEEYECEAQEKLVFQAYLPFRWIMIGLQVLIRSYV